MLKFITFRILRLSMKNTLPKINSKLFNKIFSLSYKFFIYLKPSQIWIIVLALLNKMEFKNLITIPSIFMLFSTIFSDSNGPDLDKVTILKKLEENNLTDPSNNWENFFWLIILLALIKKFTVVIFKLLWIPFKIAFFFYLLKYFGFDFSSLFNILNNLSLGVIDWFYIQIIKFFNLFNNRND